MEESASSHPPPPPITNEGAGQGGATSDEASPPADADAKEVEDDEGQHHDNERDDATSGWVKDQNNLREAGADDFFTLMEDQDREKIDELINKSQSSVKEMEDKTAKFKQIDIQKTLELEAYKKQLDDLHQQYNEQKQRQKNKERVKALREEKENERKIAQRQKAMEVRQQHIDAQEKQSAVMQSVRRKHAAAEDCLQAVNKYGKIRMCHDAHAGVNGVCLNDFLLGGPNLINPLTDILTRFREHPIAFMTDICGFFHNIRVDERDREVFRYLWFKDEGCREMFIKQFLLRIFGAGSSLVVTSFVLRYHADKIRHFFPDNVWQMLRKSF